MTATGASAPAWLADERRSDTDPPLSHVLQEGTEPVLVVGFSAVQAPAKPPQYHNVRTLRGHRHSRLFILDEHGPGGQGCWYLGEDRGLEVADAVADLVADAADEVGAHTVVATGSSRGGFAAVYHAVRNGWDRAIAGEPQAFLGHFLRSSNVDTARHIAGSEDWRWLDGLLFDELRRSPHRPQIDLLVGSDRYMDRHIRPLVDELERLGFPYTLERSRTFASHDAIGERYTGFLLERLETLPAEPPDTILAARSCEAIPAAPGTC